MITQERLKKVLSYDEDTGVFLWAMSRRGVSKGKKPGSKDKDGYWIIMVDRTNYKAHRLAWLYFHGYYPENNIDHINRDPGDNRIKNLREVSQQCNVRNSRIRCSNISGIKGVGWSKSHKMWQAQIMITQRAIHLGFFDNKLEAACARLAAEQAEDWAGCDSASSAYQYVMGELYDKTF